MFPARMMPKNVGKVKSTERENEGEPPGGEVPDQRRRVAEKFQKQLEGGCSTFVSHFPAGRAGMLPG